MNNRVQQRFDRSIKDAVAQSGQTQANKRFLSRVRAREKLTPAVPSNELDALIAELVARDGLQAE